MKSLFPARPLAVPPGNRHFPGSRQPALGSGNISVFRIAAFRLLSLSARGLIPRLPLESPQRWRIPAFTGGLIFWNAKQELCQVRSQAGAWERVQKRETGMTRKRQKLQHD